MNKSFCNLPLLTKFKFVFIIEKKSEESSRYSYEISYC